MTSSPARHAWGTTPRLMRATMIHLAVWAVLTLTSIAAEVVMLLMGYHPSPAYRLVQDILFSLMILATAVLAVLTLRYIRRQTPEEDR